MTNDQAPDVEAIFSAAQARKAPAERAAYLDGACGNDAELRHRVEALLVAHDEAGSFLQAPALGSVATVELTPLSEGPGTKIGPYKLLQLIGEGGFGAVYMAEQQQPVRRKVALKIIKLGMDTKQVIARFEAERQALAMMEHPNIARVLDAGATDTGRPYFVMELVKGIPITEYCDQNNLSTKERLDLFIPICRAVQHAHHKGIIHRDIKPNNVLVTLHDGKPVPKVIDFGIAKATDHRLTEKTLFTEFRQFIGTPEFMSPEQAEMSGLDIDTRTDIYSLGVLLYELLTGTTPFDAKTLRQASYGEIQRIIREVEPPKPSMRVNTLIQEGTDIAKHRRAEPTALSKLIRGDLDWIVMKAMEKDRTRRYETAKELAGDIERHLNNQPVLAGPPSVAYKMSKFIQRHRVGMLATSLIAAAVVVGSSLATVGFVQARREAAHSQRIADFLEDLFISTDPERALASDVDVEHVMATARDLFGDDHATVAAILSSRALQLQSSGELESAERSYRESLRIWREQLGEDNINVGTTLGRLGLLLLTKGDDQAAEEAFRESLRIGKALRDEESLAICESLGLLATVLSNRGEFDEAEALLRESARVREAVAPHQRLQIALAHHSLANILAIAGKRDELRDLAPRAIAAWREALPEGGLLLARLLTDYGLMYRDFSEADTAERLLREAAEIFRSSTGPPARPRTVALLALAGLLRDRGALGEAVPITIEALDVAQEYNVHQYLDDAVKVVCDVSWLTNCFTTQGSADDNNKATPSMEAKPWRWNCCPTNCGTRWNRFCLPIHHNPKAAIPGPTTADRCWESSLCCGPACRGR